MIATAALHVVEQAPLWQHPFHFTVAAEGEIDRQTVRRLSSPFTLLGSALVGEGNGDEFGEGIAMSADGARIAVGGPGNDGTGGNAGHVRVFEWDGSDWSQLGADIDGEAAGDKFGFCVSLSYDGSRLAVGAHKNDNANGASAGSVRVFEYSGGSWVKLGGDIDGEAANDAFGFTVSLSRDGSRVAGGAYKNDGAGSSAGSVRVFSYSSGSWQQIGADYDGEAADDRLGSAVALSRDGTFVSVGALQDDDGGDNSGSMRVLTEVRLEIEPPSTTTAGSPSPPHPVSDRQRSAPPSIHPSLRSPLLVALPGRWSAASSMGLPQTTDAATMSRSRLTVPRLPWVVASAMVQAQVMPRTRGRCVCMRTRLVRGRCLAAPLTGRPPAM